MAGTAYALSRISLPPALPQEQTTTLVDANDRPLAQLSGGVDRQPVSIDQVPQVVVDAVVATEDRTFFHHRGVDPVGITRAFISDILGRGSLQGGSTLTQQYVKNAYLGQQRTFSRKVKEAVLALKVERQLTKRQILERYLNTIYFGRGAYGIQAASQAYFGRSVGQLDLGQAAFLAGVIRAPEYADPARDPVTAKARRDRTLVDMAATHRITAAQATAARAAPLVAVPYVAVNQRILAPAGAHLEYFVSYVTQQLIRSYGEKTVYGGGLRVKTSIDINMQTQAFDALYGRQGLTNLKGPAGALITLDSTGAVRAMVGGRDFSTSKVNLAVGSGGGGAGRQPGSTMKPVLLAELVRENHSVLSTFRAPAQITLTKADNGKDWTVSNFNNEDFSGPDGSGTLNMIDATKDSVNTVYAQAVTAIGPGNMANMGDALGLGPNLPHYASLVLGTVDESVLQMAGAYSVFADNGVYQEPHTIVEVKDVTGKSMPLTLQTKAVLTKAQTDIITHCLRQVVLGGTGSAAGFGHQIAGKTGTTEQNTDAWFIGYSAGSTGLTTAVWMGYPDKNQPMVNIYGVKAVTGGTIPADIFRRYMIAALSEGPYRANVKFDEPVSFPGTPLGTPASAVFPTTTSTTSTTSTTAPPVPTTVAPAPGHTPSVPPVPPTAPTA
ncbi:MAG: transglycosylase domain-containing protein, partial [Acidimicrobiales bacterium]